MNDKRVSGNGQHLIEYEFKKRKTIELELKKALTLYGTFAQILNYPPLGSNVTMSLPTEQTDDIKWWEWIYIIPIGIVVWPVIGVGHLIDGRRINKNDLRKYIKKLVSHFKKHLPKLELEIQNELT